MNTKSIFMLITILLTAVITILLAVDSVNSLAYAFSGKINIMVWITPCIGLILCMLFYMMPDDKNQNNNK